MSDAMHPLLAATPLLDIHHPDIEVLVAERGWRALRPYDRIGAVYDFVRNEILKVAQFAPFEAAASFLIFPEADVSFPDQHPEAGNALLKSIEEPRPGVCFVLISERPDRLLLTIRSRCQRVRFGRLPELVLSELLEGQGVERAQADPRRFMEIAESGLRRAGTCAEPYTRVALRRTNQGRRDAADLEYTCGAGDGMRHGLWRAVTADGQAYSFYLTVPEARFTESRRIFDEMTRTFRLD